MSNDDTRVQVPIWQSPAWVTAVVGLVSAFLTIPQVVGDYFSKLQDVEIAKEQKESVRLGNLESKQEQEFRVVNSTLAQQGPERVFVLRYLASTLDDAEARNWAREEVNRLDTLARQEEELSQAKREIEVRERSLRYQVAVSEDERAKAVEELSALKAQLDQKVAEVSELQAKAGIVGDNIRSKIYLMQIKRPVSTVTSEVDLWVSAGGSGSRCSFDENNLCHVTIANNVGFPETRIHVANRDGAIEGENPTDSIERVDVFEFDQSGNLPRTSYRLRITVECEIEIDEYICNSSDRSRRS